MSKEQVHQLNQIPDIPDQVINLSLPFPKRVQRAGTFFTDEITTKGITASTGAGGQGRDHNNTAIQASFNIKASHCLTPKEKMLLLQNLKTSNRGVIRIKAQESRSSAQNTQDAIDRITHKLTQALSQSKRRKPSKIPESQKRNRLETKRRQSQKKEGRKKPNW